MQLAMVILGAVLGYLYGMNTDGFIFSSKICLFAGLTLIMPSLFKVKLSDIALLWHDRIVLIKGFFLNYLFLPLFALGIGLLTHDFGIAAGIFMLSVLSGGGMVMLWIRKSGGDTSLGFVLLFVNLLFVSLSLLMLHLFGLYTEEYFDALYSNEVNMSNFASLVIELLIVIPFVASRIVLLYKPAVELIERYRPILSNFSIFVILFYLFGLQSTQNLNDILDFEPELIWISLAAVAGFYLLTILSALWVYNLHSPKEKAAFWHTVTRYITLALLISTFSIDTFGVSMILPVMFAYIIQIPIAIFLEKRMRND
jgi:hypothetical protein